MTDTKQETLDHIAKVYQYLTLCINELHRRGHVHDASKLYEPELSGIAQLAEASRGLKYGSMAYRAASLPFKYVLEHHYAANDHHPQHFCAGIDGMNLLQIIEMLCDWKAAGEREGGNLEESLRANVGRFEIEPQLENILRNTAKALGWLE